MNGKRKFRIALLAGAAQVALLAGGCAGQPSAAGGGAGVTVVAVERAAWDREPEPGLYRITFDAERALGIRRAAARGGNLQDVGAYNAENWAIEEEADQELRARGLCNGAAKLLRLQEDGGGQSGMSGIFKCRPSVF
jgi:hypothetical protein